MNFASGFGDPRERDPKRVLDDLLDGIMTRGVITDWLSTSMAESI
jgi:hypothetical protein